MKALTTKPRMGMAAGRKTFSGAEFVVDQRRGVDSHEGDEGTEVEQLRAALVSHQESPNEGASADDQDVVAGNAVAGIDGGKDAARGGHLARPMP
jgi:hypothetical protein